MPNLCGCTAHPARDDQVADGLGRDGRQQIAVAVVSRGDTEAGQRRLAEDRRIVV